jgi:hypothetical protein
VRQLFTVSEPAGADSVAMRDPFQLPPQHQRITQAVTATTVVDGLLEAALSPGHLLRLGSFGYCGVGEHV